MVFSARKHEHGRSLYVDMADWCPTVAAGRGSSWDPPRELFQHRAEVQRRSWNGLAQGCLGELRSQGHSGAACRGEAGGSAGHTLTATAEPGSRARKPKAVEMSQ